MAVSFEPADKLAPVTDLSARFASKRSGAQVNSADSESGNAVGPHSAIGETVAKPTLRAVGAATSASTLRPHKTAVAAQQAGSADSSRMAEPHQRASAAVSAVTSAQPRFASSVSDSAPDEQEPQLSPEEIEDRALSRLARKALSEKEVRGIILDQGGSEDLADKLLVEFNRKGYVNDETLAEDLVQAHLRRKKQGPAVIKRELAQRGIPDFMIAAALDVIDDDEELRLVVEAANDRVRRMGNLERSVAERRLTGYLQRRGYASSLIRTAVDQALGSKRSGPGSVRFE